MNSAPASLLVLVFAFGVTCSCRHSPANEQKVIVLGIDGMDPTFLEQHWQDLPHLDSLRRHGDFKRLGTTTPPQSPVAWSTFITGMDPSGHGIFDFVHRNPVTLQPFSSMSRTEPPRFTLALGAYVFPLSQARVTTLRRGRSFWELLSDRGVPVTVIHMPTNFPPVKVGNAISGMGTPDLRGTLGTFTYYTNDPEELNRSVSGGRIVKVRSDDGHFVLPVEGPPNTLRKDQRFTTAEIVVDVDPQKNVARISLNGELVIVKQGEWSDWLRINFPLIRWLAISRGMIRVYAKQLHPQFELYVTPVNIDPRLPELPISNPSSYSRDVAGQVGSFYTQGIAEDTSAFRQGVFDLQEFLRQSGIVRDDEHKLLEYSLAHFNRGLLFFYFSSIDQDSHMLWGKYEAELLRTYRAIDAEIGEVTSQYRDATIIVMSDHGFNPFRRAVNLNTWLWKQGFLALNGSPSDDEAPFANVDWTRTQAYAIGLNGLYLNMKGREEEGIVSPGAERDTLMDKIRKELVEFRDPVNGRPVVEDVATPGAESGPDMVVGYSRGYRASWQTALGETPEGVLEDNTDAWIGDHCINAADVPGVLLSNRKIRLENPELKDVTVEVLSLFNVRPAPGMAGKVIF